jgi:hypothetical protein
MIRFIISRSCRDAVSGADWVNFETVDVDVPQLQEKLKGGFGESGYDIPTVIGVEILPAVGKTATTTGEDK